MVIVVVDFVIETDFKVIKPFLSAIVANNYEIIKRTKGVSKDYEKSLAFHKDFDFVVCVTVINYVVKDSIMEETNYYTLYNKCCCYLLVLLRLLLILLTIGNTVRVWAVYFR